MGSVLLQKGVTLLQSAYVCLEKMAQKEIGFTKIKYKGLGSFPPWEAG